MRSKQITFISTQLGLTDYLTWTEEDTFADLIQSLKIKYNIKILNYLKSNFQNIRKNLSLDQITIKLYYFDNEGNIQTIGNLNKVSDFVSRGIKKVFWSPEPIGGINYFKKSICRTCP